MDDLLRELCAIPGVSGEENLVCKYVSDKLSSFADVSVTQDNSVIATIGSEEARKHILFDAHIDQIGLTVTHIDKHGFIKFGTCGGFDPRILYGSTVNIHGTDELKGVICSTPPHLSKGKEKTPDTDDMFIDLGMDKNEIRNKISPGDRISLDSKFYELLNKNVASGATDDRSGVYTLIKLAEKLSSLDADMRFTILLSSREEVGRMGAGTAAYKIMPDEAIAVDVSFVKQPGTTDDIHCELDKGPMIGIAPSLSKKVYNTLIEVAKKSGISYQYEIMGGESSTNADVISLVRGGIPCGLVSIPQKYMHTGIEMVNYSDLEKTVQLLFNYARQGGAR